MKNIIKKLAVTLSASAIITAMPLSVSAATADDVVAAARGAGFLEEYVQMLQNYLNGNTFTSEQYDIMVNKLYSAGEEMDNVAIAYTGKTIAELKGQVGSSSDSSDDNSDSDSGSGSSSSGSSGSGSSSSGSKSGTFNNKNADPAVQKELEKIAKNLTDENITKILSEMVDAGKELGVDVSFEKKGDKNYILTVKDKDGNVQLVTPIGKLVDTTGAGSDDINPALVYAVCGGAVVAGCAGAYVLAVKSKKKEDRS